MESVNMTHKKQYEEIMKGNKCNMRGCKSGHDESIMCRWNKIKECRYGKECKFIHGNDEKGMQKVQDWDTGLLEMNEEGKRKKEVRFSNDMVNNYSKNQTTRRPTKENGRRESNQAKILSKHLNIERKRNEDTQHDKKFEKENQDREDSNKMKYKTKIEIRNKGEQKEFQPNQKNKIINEKVTNIELKKRHLDTGNEIKEMKDMFIELQKLVTEEIASMKTMIWKREAKKENENFWQERKEREREKMHKINRH